MGQDLNWLTGAFGGKLDWVVFGKLQGQGGGGGEEGGNVM